MLVGGVCLWGGADVELVVSTSVLIVGLPTCPSSDDGQTETDTRHRQLPTGPRYVRLSVRPSVCLSVRQSVRPSVCPSVRLSVHPSIRLTVRPTAKPPVGRLACPSRRPSSAYLSTLSASRPSRCLSVSRSACRSTCLPVRPSSCRLPACSSVRPSVNPPPVHISLYSSFPH